MHTLTYDSYIGIIIPALFADLGLFCTIVSTNYNFRKKINLIILIIIFNYLVYMFLNSRLNNDDFIHYLFNHIKNKLNFYISKIDYDGYGESYFIGSILFTVIGNLVICKPIFAILKKIFDKKKTPSLEIRNKTSFGYFFINCLLYIIGNFYITFTIAVYFEMSEYLLKNIEYSTYSFSDITSLFSINYIKILVIMSFIKYLSYKYFSS